MDEGAQDRAGRVPVHHQTRLTESHAAAAHASHRELATDQSVEGNAPGHEIAAMLFRAEWWIEGLADLSLDECQCTTGHTGWKCAGTGNVSVAFQPSSGTCLDRIAEVDPFPCCRGDTDCFDAPGRVWRC